MGCCDSIARCLLIMFNFVFWLSGAAILGVGIWILVDPEIKEYLDVIKSASEDDDALQIAAYILIGFGAFVFIVGFCGCCGAIRKSKCLLGFYIFFLIIVCGGELAAGIYVAIYQGEAEDKLNTGLSKSIKSEYDSNLKTAWDQVQKKLKCCGGLGPVDYENSTWAVAQTDGSLIPESCCKLDASGSPVNKSNCQKKTSTDFYYDTGCKAALSSWIDDHAVILIGVGCGIAALELIGLVCAICFCRHMDSDKYSSN